MGENDRPVATSGESEFPGEAIVYRARGMTALDVQRAADALLRNGQKPSIAAVREHLGGGSPNTVGPLLDQYWRSLGLRLPEGPKALERVPESVARMTEALWLRSLAAARETAKALHRPTSSSQQPLADLEQKVIELNAALAQSRAQLSERESELLSSLRECQGLKEQVRQLTSLLAAEQALRAQDQRTVITQRHELDQRRSQLLELARRRVTAKARPTRKRRPRHKDATTVRRKAFICTDGKEAKVQRKGAPANDQVDAPGMTHCDGSSISADDATLPGEPNGGERCPASSQNFGSGTRITTVRAASRGSKWQVPPSRRTR